MTDDDAYLGDIARPASPSEQQKEEETPGGVMPALTVLAGDIGELRAELREFREQLADVLATVDQLGSRVAALSTLESKVHALTDAVDLLLGQGDADAVRPVDLAHLTHENRGQVLADLVHWVRDVVFTGWPWTQERLRPCWLHHPDLINRMLWLRAAYSAAYDQPKARPHAAADWHRWLDDVMAHADRHTADCPSPEEHAAPLPPRDDLAVLSAVQQHRRAVLTEITQLMQVTTHAGYPADQVRAAQQRMKALIDAHGITEEEYNAFVHTLNQPTP